MKSTVLTDMQKKPLMVAHRGLSGIETENTAAAFVAAGNRTYYGVECDVHKTLDGKYVVIHDHDTARVAGGDGLQVRQSTFDALRALTLLDCTTGEPRGDLVIPTLAEYIQICKRYGKRAVLELKDDFTEAEILEICDIIAGLDYLDCVTFISFCYQNLVYLRKKYPAQSAQLLKSHPADDLIDRLTAYHLDLDFNHKNLTREMVEQCHRNGIKVNTWTVDDPARAAELADWGVDYITTNILE